MTVLTQQEPGYIVITITIRSRLDLFVPNFQHARMHMGVAAGDYRPNTTQAPMSCWDNLPQLWSSVEHKNGRYSAGKLSMYIDQLPTYAYTRREAAWRAPFGVDMQAAIVPLADLPNYIYDWWAEKYPLEALAHLA